MSTTPAPSTPPSLLESGPVSCVDRGSFQGHMRSALRGVLPLNLGCEDLRILRDRSVAWSELERFWPYLRGHPKPLHWENYGVRDETWRRGVHCGVGDMKLGTWVLPSILEVGVRGFFIHSVCGVPLRDKPKSNIQSS